MSVDTRNAVVNNACRDNIVPDGPGTVAYEIEVEQGKEARPAPTPKKKRAA